MEKFVIEDKIYNESVSPVLSRIIHPVLQSVLDDMVNKVTPTPSNYRSTLWWTHSKSLPFEDFRSHLHFYPQIQNENKIAALQGIIQSLLDVVNR